ncbi:MAG: hypothetical protein P1U63_02215 [Coxiellaceae bacterium]|nr:hypothetical protein [Coxiellaceae bacterium]
MNRVALQYNQPLSRAQGVIRHSSMWSTTTRAANDIRQTGNNGQDGISTPTPHTQQSGGAGLFSHSVGELYGSVMQQVNKLVTQYHRLGKQVRNELLELLQKLFGTEFKNIDAFKLFIADHIKSGNYGSIKTQMDTLSSSMRSHPNDLQAVVADIKQHLQKQAAEKQKRDQNEQEASSKPGMKR